MCVHSNRHRTALLSATISELSYVAFGAPLASEPRAAVAGWYGHHPLG